MVLHALMMSTAGMDIWLLTVTGQDAGDLQLEKNADSAVSVA